MARKLDRDSRVIAFEPDRSNFEILKVYVHLNGINNVILHNLWLWREEGKLPLFADPKNPVVKSRLTLKQMQTLHGQVVQVDTLNPIIETRNVQSNLIKIDVEGAEVEVLKRGIQILRRQRPDIIFECLTEEELGAIEQLLMPMGYVIGSAPLRWGTRNLHSRLRGGRHRARCTLRRACLAARCRQMSRHLPRSGFVPVQGDSRIQTPACRG